MPPPADIVKVAIEWPGAFPKLMEIDQVGVKTNNDLVINLLLPFKSTETKTVFMTADSDTTNKEQVVSEHSYVQ